ncbi:MAG: S1C family serine protease [Candidatus Falkowbacteria bacterium]
MPNSNNKLITIMILSTLFGLASGIVGSMIARAFLLEKTFNIPLVGDINFLDDNNGRPSIIIRSADKVVVEQDAKAAETANTASKSIVGIFRKNPSPSLSETVQGTSTAAFDPDDFYRLEDNLAEGFIITSDGWIITDFIPEKMTPAPPVTDKVQAALKKEVLAEYVIISKDKTVYQVDDIIADKKTGYSFWRIKANDLPVTGFVGRKGIANGQQVVAVNWEKWSWVTTVIGKEDDSPLARSSDRTPETLVLADKPATEFMGSFLFDFSGNLVALINEEGKIKPIYHFTGAINYLLKNKDVKYAGLGINYVDLSALTDGGGKDNVKGSLIYKTDKEPAVLSASPAALAGLRSGDIITAVDGMELGSGNDLTSIIAEHMAGDEIAIEFLRREEKKSVKVKLGELK